MKHDKSTSSPPKKITNVENEIRPSKIDHLHGQCHWTCNHMVVMEFERRKSRHQWRDRQHLAFFKCFEVQTTFALRRTGANSGCVFYGIIAKQTEHDVPHKSTRSWNNQTEGNHQTKKGTNTPNFHCNQSCRQKQANQSQENCKALFPIVILKNIPGVRGL